MTALQPHPVLTPSTTLDALLPSTLTQEAQGPLDAAAQTAAHTVTRLDIFNGYLGAFVLAFVVTLLTTPLMRRLALTNGVVDVPHSSRKMHRAPVAYLGGVAVYLGLLAAIAYAYLAPRAPLLFLYEPHPTSLLQRRDSLLVILAGMTAIMLAGLLDDVVGVSPRVKIAGMLFAAAFLAMADIGVRVAQGVLGPIGSLIGNPAMTWDVTIPLLGASVHLDLIYWAGTLIIALCVLGACNASNLLDGLDGLLTGVTAIAAAGLLFIALTLAMLDDGPLDASRIVLCMGLLGATLGFLPHNFRPASIFLGDAGSLLLGFVAIVLVLSLGDTGRTSLVVAGLLIYALPIIDTSLAIVRRRMAGQPIFSADKHHLHHMLARRVGVVGAVFSLYAIAAAFAGLGVLVSLGRARLAYAIALTLAAYIAVTAVKMARRRVEQEAAEQEALPPSPAGAPTAPAADGAPLTEEEPAAPRLV
ncbi:MAG: undecaprenyl/decaprenyl-phosphate alpha-N-acetylglucosaminyl 1-phosphate transferase [Planctomycetota bacterium]|nr:MAG: undecaprenyl/decaprenyl-phosphate alpha-N-acetylglucosaminyl 1-phosphate transferase [Planctomycetota bacterium]